MSTTYHKLSLLEDPTIVRVDAEDIPAASRQVRFNSGAIASVYDLYGAQAFVSFRYDDWDENLDGVAKSQEGSLLQFMKMKIGGVEIFLRKCKAIDEDLQVCSLSDANDFRGIDLGSVIPAFQK